MARVTGGVVSDIHPCSPRGSVYGAVSRNSQVCRSSAVYLRLSIPFSFIRSFMGTGVLLMCRIEEDRQEILKLVQ
ncbi:hypothetical protein J6590_032803 [Homalodisca vitripennis]|nr:hypothetical protein J6590_032803 [Homalodisca vitripennis]